MIEKKITGIVLAGGKSSRMGAEKGLIPFRGKPMIEYAIEALLPFCNQILISTNATAYDFLGFEVVKDEIPDSGPMGGIYSCLKQSKNEINFVLSCDMPLITSYVISQIIDSIDEFDTVIPWHGNEYYEPLCAAYRKTLIPEFEKFILSGKFKIQDLINNTNHKKFITGAKDRIGKDVFFNVNSKVELETLLKPKQNSEMREIPNLLMIAGTGRNVGKTSFACELISAVSKTHEVVGIKISPHLHQQVDGQKVIDQDGNWQIIEETNPLADKDSSRMLRAGASIVFYLQTIDKNIREAFDLLLELIPENQPVVCESGALLDYAKPGMFLLVKRLGQASFKKGLDLLAYAPDSIVEFDGEKFDLSPDEFYFKSGLWQKTKNPAL